MTWTAGAVRFAGSNTLDPDLSSLLTMDGTVAVVHSDLQRIATAAAIGKEGSFVTKAASQIATDEGVSLSGRDHCDGLRPVRRVQFIVLFAEVGSAAAGERRA